jgi:CoA transferase family III/enoyl-CoA hydratase/isomerase-like protein
VGKGRALQLILSAEMISAQEAYRIGLVNEIVPAADLLPRAEAILRKIAGNAPMAVKFALTAVNKGLETSQEEGLLLEASYFFWPVRSLDLKSPSAPPVLKRLVEWADMLIVNTPHPARKRLNLEYDDVAKWNPKLIYADLSGFGEKGPDADLPRVGTQRPSLSVTHFS